MLMFIHPIELTLLVCLSMIILVLTKKPREVQLIHSRYEIPLDMIQTHEGAEIEAIT